MHVLTENVLVQTTTLHVCGFGSADWDVGKQKHELCSYLLAPLHARCLDHRSPSLEVDVELEQHADAAKDTEYDNSELIFVEQYLLFSKLVLRQQGRGIFPADLPPLCRVHCVLACFELGFLLLVHSQIYVCALWSTTTQLLYIGPGGSVRGERANFTRLVLGCIEANFCK